MADTFYLLEAIADKDTKGIKKAYAPIDTLFVSDKMECISLSTNIWINDFRVVGVGNLGQAMNWVGKDMNARSGKGLFEVPKDD